MNDASMGDALPSAAASGGPVLETLQLFSHDIRSALSDVIGGLRLIDRDRLTAEALLQIDRVQAAADTLAALVDGALMAALGEASMQADDDRIGVEDWLAALSGRWAGRASEARGTFELVCESAIPHRLLVPQVALDRILGNLISNAFQHAPGAAVALRVQCARGVGLTCAVTDAGAGYPQAVLDWMGQLDPAAPAGTPGAALVPQPMGRTSGTGLGLRIAAELSRQIGGTLTLGNAPDGGGTALLHLPDALLDWDGDTPHAPHGAATVALPAPDMDGLRILVAEDNMTNQTILRHMLGRMGADTMFAPDGQEALDLLALHAFDIALIDIEMPRVSGLQVMQAVRARADAVAAMPMVALTAYVLRDNREAIYAAGADGIIGKPISSAAEFGRAILRYAGRPTGLLEPEDVLARAPDDDTLGRKMDDRRFSDLLTVAGPDGALELLERLYEDLSAVRATLDSGIAAGDLAEVRAQTHILIAISGAVGADRLYRLTEVLNIAAKRRRSGDLKALYAPCRADLSDLVAYVARAAAENGLHLPPE